MIIDPNTTISTSRTIRYEAKEGAQKDVLDANFMMKDEYLSFKEVSGKQYYQTVTGDISEGIVIMLREVDFGGITLRNVKASVVKNQTTPLLLGQSVLFRLRRIEIDNENKVIKIRR